MLDYLNKAKLYLWAVVEIGFLTVLAVMLIYLILGDNSGVFVSGVADNVVKFASAIPEQSLVGIASCWRWFFSSPTACAEPAEAAGVERIGGLPKRIQARTDRA